MNATLITINIQDRVNAMMSARLDYIHRATRTRNEVDAFETGLLASAGAINDACHNLLLDAIDGLS